MHATTGIMHCSHVCYMIVKHGSSIHKHTSRSKASPEATTNSRAGKAITIGGLECHILGHSKPPAKGQEAKGQEHNRTVHVCIWYMSAFPSHCSHVSAASIYSVHTLACKKGSCKGSVAGLKRKAPVLQTCWCPMQCSGLLNK